MKKAAKSMKNIGKGIGNFISNPNAIRSAMGVPASEQTVDVKATSLGSEPIVKAKAAPKQDLVPNPVKSTAITKKRRGRPKKLQTLAQVQADIDARNQTYRSPITGGLLPVKKSKKVTSLAKGGMDGDDKKKNVDKALEKDFKIDPKMKKAFSDAMALPAKSAAVALIDLLEKIPAPSKEASKILNRNITKIANAFKLGAASTEVANDEEDNDEKEEGKSPTLLQALIGKAMNAFGGGEKTEGETGGSGATPELPGSAPQQQLMPAQMGDPSTGKRAPYTGTADGIGMGDGGKGTRAMQPIKKRKGLAKKLFGMTPMGMAFNAGAKAFKGLKSLKGKAAAINEKVKGAAGKALAATPMGMGVKLGMKALQGVKNIFNPPDEPQQSLTELTEKTVKESRDAKNAKVEKLAEGAAGTGDAAMAGLSGGGGYTGSQEGGELAQPNIEESPFINAYNVTSQF